MPPGSRSTCSFRRSEPAQKSRMGENLDSLLDLEKNLIETGYTLQDFPWVIQYNKRDLSEIETIEKLQARLNFFGAPFYECVAVKGHEVLSTLQGIIEQVIQKIIV